MNDAALVTQTLTVGRDASGIVQISGSSNTIYVIASDTRRPEPAPATTLTLGRNPYRSLDAFDEESAGLFFGREALTAALLSRLEHLARADGVADAGRLLAILGPSGSGKSSVARAGLVTAIARSALPRLHEAEVAVFSPGRQPVRALAAVLARTIMRDPAPVEKMEEFARTIGRRGEDGDWPGLIRIAQSRGNQRPLILLVDQFEETYTLARPAGEKDPAAEAAREERAAFVQNLLAAAREPALNVFVVLTLRIDFYGAVAEHPDMSVAIRTSHELVPAMTEAELRAAIATPAALHGLSLPEAVVDRLVVQARDNPSALPLVQHALFRFWNVLEAAGADAASQKAAYDILANLGGAMAATARELMQALPSDSARALAWGGFLRGIQLGEGVRDTRRRVMLSEILPQGTGLDAVRAALKPFVQERLLSMGGEMTRPGEAWMEITHESLILTWTDLRNRLRDDRDAERFARRALEAADLWRAGSGDVWHGIDLKLLQDHARTHALTEVQATFLAASARAARRRVWLGRVAVVALLLLTSGAIGAALWIGAQNGELLTTTRTAQLQEARAVSILARQATELGDGMTGMLAALEMMPDPRQANPRPPSVEASMALLDAWSRNRESATLIGHTNNVTSAAFSPDGKHVVTASSDDTARLWDISGAAPTSIVLAGHTDTVTSAAFSPDGKRVVTASWDNTARLWDISGPAPTSIVLAGHKGRVISAMFSPNGERVVTASWDNTARLWDISGPAPTSIVLAGHTDRVNSAAFSPDGKRVVTASDDSTARLWDISGAAPTSIVLAGHTHRVTRAAFSPDGKRVVTASWDNTARLWDISGATPTSIVLAGYTSFVTSAAFSPDGRRVVTESLDNTPRVWDISSAVPTSIVLAGHTHIVISAAFSPNGKRVVTASLDNTARLWDISGGAAPTSIVLAGHTGSVNGAAFSPDGKRVVTASSDNTARLWDISGAAPTSIVLAGHTSPVTSAVFSPDGKRVVTASSADTARLWDMSGAAPTSIVLAGHTSFITSAAFGPNGKRVATASSDNTARVWDVSSAAPTFIVLAGHTGHVTSAAFSPDGKRVVTASYDGTARLWDISGAAHTSVVLAGHTDDVTSAAFSPDGKRVVTASWDNTARLWDISGAAPTSIVLAGHTGGVSSAAFSPDGKHVVTASYDKTARLWDISGAVPTSIVLAGHTGPVDNAAFSPDGKRVVTASNDNTARLWDISGAAPTSIVLAGHTDIVISAAFSPDGKRVVTASDDRTARLWDISGAAPTSIVLAGHTDRVTSAAFSPDGKRVVTTSWDGTAIIHPIPDDDELVVLARRSLTRCLTVAQREALGLPVQASGGADRNLIRPPPC